MVVDSSGGGNRGGVFYHLVAKDDIDRGDADAGDGDNDDQPEHNSYNHSYRPRYNAARGGGCTMPVAGGTQ